MLYEAILGISKPTKEEIVGAVIAFSGMVIAVLADKAPYSSLLALLGALTGAAYFALGRLMRKGGVSLTGCTLVCYGTSSLVLLAYSFISNQQILPAK
jgi:drug/metabolite transporter (DMT)-like permease